MSPFFFFFFFNFHHYVFATFPKVSWFAHFIENTLFKRELGFQNSNSGTCKRRKLRSACAPMHSDQNTRRLIAASHESALLKQWTRNQIQTQERQKTYLLICAPSEDSDQPNLIWSESLWDAFRIDITKTCLYNFDPLKPHFYTVKLGFTGVYIICLISAQNIDCEYSLEPPGRGGSNEYPQSIFWAEIWKISDFFLSENFLCFGSKIFSIFE